MFVLNFPAFEKKNTQLMTVSSEMVRMAKSRPGKNQSERSNLPCHIIIIISVPFVSAKNYFSDSTTFKCCTYANAEILICKQV